MPLSISNISKAVGSSGTSGYSGYSGTGGQGTSGTSGANGVAGFSGTSGTSGVAGQSGTSGVIGTSGTSGVVGTSGTSGTSGVIGTSGTSGVVGTSGTSGVIGISGTSGTSGVSGYSGVAGSGSANTLNVTNDTATTALYPVMVGAAGSVQTVKSTTSKLVFNASTGQLDATIFNSTSDESLKTNIIKIENACNVLRQIDGVSFAWKENNNKSYGFIAQNVEKVIPEIVTQTQGIKTLNYDAIIAFLVEANKELQIRVEALEKKLL